MNKIIFLDVDGVLNHPVFGGPPFAPMIDRSNAAAFNRIVRETGANVVLSSTWRSMVLGGAMTAEGFGMLLLTHRIRCRVVGVTPRRAAIPDRGGEITAWLESNRFKGRYLAIDDDDDGISAAHPMIQTDGNFGLTEVDADRAVGVLNGVEGSTS